MKRLDLIGQRFGRLTVLKLSHKTEYGNYIWECKCDCGNIHLTSTSNLKGKRTSSCGCLNIELSTERLNKVRKMGKECPMYGRFGKDHPCYKPNLTEEDRMDRRLFPGYKNWVKEVYKLDNYTCQKCGGLKKLNAHHINGYNNNQTLRTEVSNGITLCEDCHREFHHLFGKLDNTRAQMIEFFKYSAIKA